MAITKGGQRLGSPIRVLFYTISTLFLHNTPQALSKFYQIISSRIRTQVGMILYASHEGVNEARHEMLMKSLVDGLVEMRFDDSMTRQIRLHHLRGERGTAQWLSMKGEDEDGEKAAPRSVWALSERGGKE